MKKQALGIITTAMLILPLIAGTLDVQADETTNSNTTAVAPDHSISKFENKKVNIQVTADNYKNDDYNKKQQNDGSSTITGVVSPVKGIKFTLYDVTKAYNAGKTPSYIQKEYKTIDKTELTTAITKEDGIVTFENLDVTKEKQFTAYLIVQTNSTNAVAGNAVPMVVTMPAVKTKDANGNVTAYFGENKTETETIKLYPKLLKGSFIDEPKNPYNPNDSNNPLPTTKPEKPTNPADDTDADNPANHYYDKDGNIIANELRKHSVDYGQNINFGYTVTLPTTENWEKVTLTTKYGSSATDLKLGNVVVSTKDGKLSENQDYKLYTDENGKFIIDTLNPELAGKEITVSYNATMNNSVGPGKEVTSSVNMDFGDKTIDYNLKSVYTGGNNFQVQDANSTTAVTNGKFYLENNDGKFAKLTDKKSDHNYSFVEWVTKKEDATHIDLGATSAFTVKGLKDAANYKVYQDGAHKDYVNPNAVVNDFTVKGLNSTEKNDATYANNTEIIKNVKKGILPSTGGTGIALFLTVGTLLMGGSYLWFRRSKDSAEV